MNFTRRPAFLSPRWRVPSAARCDSLLRRPLSSSGSAERSTAARVKISTSSKATHHARLSQGAERCHLRSSRR